MHRLFAGICLGLASLIAAGAAERNFEVGGLPPGAPPTNFVSTLAGEGKPGKWQVMDDEVPFGLAPLDGSPPAMAKKSVITQVAKDFTDEHFPILLLGSETYGDFTFSTRFKITGGVIEQMAGIVFRLQDEKNYYVLRASAGGNNFRFYKVVNGERGKLIGPEMPITKDAWHELKVECDHTQIKCFLDGAQAIPTLNDNSFSLGRIGFITKSDARSHFTDARVVYTPHEPFIQSIVRDVLLKYPKLVGLKVFMLTGTPPQPKLVAGNNETEIGRPGETNLFDVILNGKVYYGKEGEIVSVVMPLRDRNGEALAAVRIQTKTFKGQTEENAITRAVPIVKRLQEKITTADDFK